MHVRVRPIVAAFDWAGGLAGTEDTCGSRAVPACSSSASSYREPSCVARVGELAIGEERVRAQESAWARFERWLSDKGMAL